MELASEMVVRSGLAGLKIVEVPTTLAPAGRSRPPHLRAWRDGWRHLRFLLLLSPRWLFIYPGALILLLGALLSSALLLGPTTIPPNVTIDVHSLIVASMAMLVGTQCLTFGIIARRYSTVKGLLPPNPHLERLLKWVTLERVLVLSMVILLVGLVGIGYSILEWAAASFGPLQFGPMIRILTVSCTLVALSLQIAFAGFLAAIFALKTE